MELSGKNVVVTGGSQGIGATLADEFSAAGAKVLVVARSADKLAAVAERTGGHYIAGDLTDADFVDGLVARCVDTLGHVDVWVNNAGLETSDAFAEVGRDTLRTVARLNLEAPMLLTRDVVDHMLSRGSGHVVQMSSVAGAITFPGLAAYCGTKAGLTHLTETIRLELSKTPIGFTVVSPGPVDTDMWWRLEDGESYSTPALRRFSQLGFLPKITPETVARKTVAAVAGGKGTVRVPARFNLYHYLNNAPRRLIPMALLGVKLRRPSQGS